MIKVTNPKNNLSKDIIWDNYTKEEVDKIIVFYTNLGWKVEIKPDLEG